MAGLVPEILSHSFLNSFFGAGSWVSEVMLQLLCFWVGHDRVHKSVVSNYWWIGGVWVQLLCHSYHKSIASGCQNFPFFSLIQDFPNIGQAYPIFSE